MTAVGILNLIAGGMAIVTGGMMIVLGPWLRDTREESRDFIANLPPDPRNVELAKLMGETDTMVRFLPAFGTAALLTGILLTAACIGFLRMRPWARFLMLGLSWFFIAGTFAMIPVRLALGVEWAKAVELSSLAFWVLCVTLLMSREWRTAFAASAERTRSAPLSPAIAGAVV